MPRALLPRARRPLKVWLRVILLADTATVATSQQDVAFGLNGLIVSRVIGEKNLFYSVNPFRFLCIIYLL